jgi:hypothetical protein
MIVPFTFPTVVNGSSVSSTYLPWSLGVTIFGKVTLKFSLF